jgi:hypothetical protein
MSKANKPVTSQAIHREVLTCHEPRSCKLQCLGGVSDTSSQAATDDTYRVFGEEFWMKVATWKT